MSYQVHSVTSVVMSLVRHSCRKRAGRSLPVSGSLGVGVVDEIVGIEPGIETSLRLPAGSVGDDGLWRRGVARQLFTELENGEGERQDEGSEAQLEGVPRLDAQDADEEGDERKGLQQQENRDWHQNLLQFALLTSASCKAQKNCIRFSLYKLFL